MKTIFALLMFSVMSWAVDLPGGSTAKLLGTEGTGFLVLSSGSGRSEYLVAVQALLGIQPKSNGSGCILYILTDKGTQETEVATTRDEILIAVKQSRATLSAK
jgi:hypothetical protein